MRGTVDASRISIAVLLILFALLPVLAVLQYQWIGQVSQTEKERMINGLRAGAEDLSRQFNGDVNEIDQALHGGRPGREKSLDEIASHLSEWRVNSPNRDIVSNFYFVDLSRGKVDLFILDSDRGAWTSIPWPDSLTSLRFSAADFPPPPSLEIRDGTFLAVAYPVGPPPLEPPLVHGVLAAQLNIAVIRESVLPGLIAKFLPKADGLGFAVRVVSAANPGQIVFQSDPSLAASFFSNPDLTFPLLDVQEQRVRPPLGRLPGADAPPDRPPPPERERDGPPGPHQGPPGLWKAKAKHQSGSLEAAVSNARNRNLAISLGVLVILGSALTVLYVSTRRAQWLTKLQMDFVAGVSHELRTPLAVICSAADNLSHGVVTDEKRVQHYGRLIEGQGRQLANMVEQILAFAGAQAGRLVQPPSPVDLNAVIDEALSASSSDLQDAGFAVEKKIDANLPQVLADPMSLRHCLTNLLNNAVKYSAGGKWVRVSAESSGGARPVMHLRVEDHGPGIDPADLPHIFEPFYRGKAPTGQPIRGAGLGLSLVKRIMEAHGGSVNVSSHPGQGTCFTLTLPISGNTNT